VEDAHTSVLIDPEGYEDSEQQFASSVVPDAEDAASVHDLMADDEPLGDLSFADTGTPVVTPQMEAAATTLVTAATSEPPAFYRPAEPPVWRDEVSSRVDAYQAKRGRGRRYDGNSSLSLNFEPLPELELASPARYGAVRLEPVERPPEAKVLEFPKPVAPAAMELPLADELAEPVVETPRILDVPEGAHALPEQPLADIKLAELEPAPVARSVVPALPIAPLGPRVGAGLIDLLVILTATAIFGMIFMMIAKELPQGRELAACALALPALLWAVYHYLFLVRCGTTPGMEMAQLRLAHFQETARVSLNQRRARALAMSVSAMSLWLGFLWTVIDQDRLAWHDRISHTFLANE
jgi:uncharacterized RDD family membrane protein YckC